MGVNLKYMIEEQERARVRAIAYKVIHSLNHKIKVMSDHPGRSGQIEEVFGPYRGKLLVKIRGRNIPVNPDKIRFIE